jgi:uncharacterized protein (DUF302 family)
MLIRNLAFAAILAAVSVVALPAFAVDGLITRPSSHSVDTTIERFEAAAKKRGFIVFGRLDHSAAATSVGLKMPRSTVIVFGNPRLGTPVFIKVPTVAIDLPPKAMVWEDADGKVFLSYNSAEFILGPVYGRHGIQVPQAASEQLASAFTSIADEAVQ